MTDYIIYFNQQWVGEHSEEWFRGRGPLARAVVADMEAAGVLVYAGGLVEEADAAVAADATGGTLEFREGFVRPDEPYLGGLTIVRVADDAEARMWAGRVAEACGWPQELRPIK